MRVPLMAVCLVCLSPLAAAQERDVPKDSTRVVITGCVRGRALVAQAPESGEPVGSAFEPGRRFRLAGDGKLLKRLREEKGKLVEVTGLMRANQVSPGSQGMPVAGGRIRIGGTPPVATDPTRSPGRDPLG
ncbi:MAG: hypothetical protein KJ061_12735, partial [Vicinamibacteraceae bacterium]|nr:hypothetical protein [Vicinamibacteraceae bacterium]